MLGLSIFRMTPSKILLTLVVAFALAQKALARHQGALICEHARVRGEIRSSQLYPCYSSSANCGSDYVASDYSFPGSRWDYFRYSKMYHLYCGGTTSKTGICYYSGGSYYFTDSCPLGHEAVVLLVADYQRRRLGEEDDGAFDGPELEVEIDGEMITILNPEFDE